MNVPSTEALDVSNGHLETRKVESSYSIVSDIDEDECPFPQRVY